MFSTPSPKLCIHEKHVAGYTVTPAGATWRHYRLQCQLPASPSPTTRLASTLASCHASGSKPCHGYGAVYSGGRLSRPCVHAQVSNTSPSSSPTFTQPGAPSWLPWMTLIAAVAAGQAPILVSAVTGQIDLPAGAAVAAVVSQRLCISCFYALCVLFTCYSCSWVVDSRVPWLQQLGQWFNVGRKAWCAAMGWAHVLSVAGAAGWYFSLLAAQPLTLLQLHLPGAVASVLSGTWPLLLATSLNLVLLGFVELRARITRKALMLRLDEQAPGRAHSHMVQGAQSIGRVYTLATLLAACVVLALLGVGHMPSSIIAAALLMAGAAALTEEEVAETQLTRATPARQ